MYLVLDKEDFIKDKKGTSLFYYILLNLQIPVEKRDNIKSVEVQVESFEVLKQS